MGQGEGVVGNRASLAFGALLIGVVCGPLHRNGEIEIVGLIMYHLN